MSHGEAAASWPDRILHGTMAVLVAAQAAVVAIQVVARHVLRQPYPWTEEIARVLLVWLMCVGGIAALRQGRHPRVTALLRLVDDGARRAIDRGLRLVLLVFFLALTPAAWRLTVTSAAEQLPASGLSGAVISIVLPAALLLMSAAVVAEIRSDGPAVWRDRRSLAWSLGAASAALASVLGPLLAGAAPLVVLISGFLVTAALGVPLAFTLALTAVTYLLGIGGVSLTILPIKILGAVDSFVLLAIPLFILGGGLMETGGISERIVDLAMAVVGRVRGGLAMVAVVAEILFSGISGSTAADVSAISALLVPSMRRAGYSGAESVSVVAAASAMGILVPPCLTMVVLGSIVNLSIVALFLVIGALLEGLPALLIFGPILFPISRSVGIDPVHYGIVIIAAMGIAFFLPPVGVGLSIAAGIARVDIDDVSRTYVPYLVALLIGLAVIAAFPPVTLVLPRWLLGYR